MVEIKDIEKAILDISMRICKRGEGAMFIIGDKLEYYKFLVPQDIKQFNIIDNPKTVESLALQDGCIWISTDGTLKGYGIMITNLTPLLNKGTRHASAISSSKQGNRVFLVSEEERKIRVFEGGKIIMQIDPLEKGVEKRSSEITDLLESLGAGTLGVIGGSALGIVGIALMPGVIVFGGVYWMIKRLLNKNNGGN